jgi:uncharacterized protein YciI
VEVRVKQSKRIPWTAMALMLIALASGWPARADQSPAPQLPLFAVEITVGSRWDASKPAQDQAFFREHCANLKRLRDLGSLVMGARYSDKGLVVLAAENEVAARAMMDADPSVAAGTFKYAVHPMNVFYAGTVANRPIESTQK